MGGINASHCRHFWPPGEVGAEALKQGTLTHRGRILAPLYLTGFIIYRRKSEEEKLWKQPNFKRTFLIGCIVYTVKL